MHEATGTLTAPTSIPTDLAVHIARALGYRATTTEFPVGTAFDECTYSSAHDELDERPAVVTIYGSADTLDICLACMQRALASFHVDTGNDPDRTHVEISVLAQAATMADTSWTQPTRLASVVDRDGREGFVTAHEDLFTGSHRVTVDSLEFDPATPHGRAALIAIQTAIAVALGQVA